MDTKFPTTVEEAAQIVYKPLSHEFKLDFTKESKEQTLPQFHSTMGRAIRNKFGLWNDNSILLLATGKSHPDDASWVIMGEIYDKCADCLQQDDCKR